MKKIVLFVLLVLSLSLIFAAKAIVFIQTSSEDKPGQKLLELYKNALVKTNDYEIVDTLKNDMFVLNIVTQDPLGEAIIGSDNATFCSTSLAYMHEDYPIYVTSFINYCLYKDKLSEAADMMVTNTYDMINQCIEVYPEFFEASEDSDDN